MSKICRLAFSLVVLVLFAGACTSAAADSASVTPSGAPTPAMVSPTPTPASSAVPAPSPKPPAATPTPPANRLVSFSSLRPGVYPVHLHSRCSGAQEFHIAVLQSLAINSAGSGAIEVPRGYFGRGLCVIVYGSPQLATVIATRQI